MRWTVHGETALHDTPWVRSRSGGTGGGRARYGRRYAVMFFVVNLAHAAEPKTAT